jgi:hypothetical protein
MHGEIGFKSATQAFQEPKTKEYKINVWKHPSRIRK